MKISSSYTPVLPSAAVMAKKEEEERRLAALRPPWADLHVEIRASQSSLRDEINKLPVFEVVPVRLDWSLSMNKQKEIIKALKGECVYVGGNECHPKSRWTNPFVYLSEENISEYMTKILQNRRLVELLPSLVGKKLAVVNGSWHHHVLSYLIRQLYTLRSFDGSTEIVMRVFWDYLDRTSGKVMMIRRADGRVMNVLRDQLEPVFRD